MAEQGHKITGVPEMGDKKIRESKFSCFIIVLYTSLLGEGHPLEVLGNWLVLCPWRGRAEPPCLGCS